jgi:hypothetical protein
MLTDDYKEKLIDSTVFNVVVQVIRFSIHVYGSVFQIIFV